MTNKLDIERAVDIIFSEPLIKSIKKIINKPMKNKECTHCESCDTEAYWTVVDIGFLRRVENLIEELDDIKPDWYVSKGFKEGLNKHIKEAQDMGNRGFENSYKGITN